MVSSDPSVGVIAIRHRSVSLLSADVASSHLILSDKTKSHSPQSCVLGDGRQEKGRLLCSRQCILRCNKADYNKADIDTSCQPTAVYI